ncbi:MAG: amino acid adenylation domain-containing protein, partial [Lysobacter sp.]|nr:amino acid adenylation domain-containing protein [Lysobacter sp.]
VALGYLNRPDATAGRFLLDPFSGVHGARMYRTGDLGRWLPDGSIEYLGRQSEQRRLRGIRIETGIIESALAQCPGVREAAVLVRRHAADEDRLVAYVVMDEGAAMVQTALRRRIAAVLPDYMLPSSFIALDCLPLTPAHTLDASALPAPESRRDEEEAHVAPSQSEESLTQIWKALFALHGIERHENFFDLGGNSLKAIRLAALIAERFRIEPSVRAVFESPTIAELSAYIDRQAKQDPVSIVVVPRDRPLPVSSAQQRLWFIDRLEGRSHHYNMPAGLRLLGRLDARSLRATLDRVVARHEILRTRFEAVDGVPVQVVGPEDSGFDLAQYDLRTLDEADREVEVRRHNAEEAQTPFDLERGPLLRGRLLQLREDEHILLVTQHHAVSDGWSFGVLVQEVSALYTAFHQGLPDPLPPLAIQYADYAVWERQQLQGEDLERLQEFWRDQLGGAPALLQLPTDHSRPPVQIHTGAVEPLAISPQLTAKLRVLAERHNVTLFMLLMAAWALLLARVSGQSDLVVGTPVANRRRTALEPLIGMFVNTLGIRVRVDDDPTVDDLLQQIRATSVAAFAHQDLPFEQVVDLLQPERSASHSPIFQASFTWHNQPGGGPLSLPGLTLAEVETPLTTTLFDLSLHLRDEGENFGGGLVYSCSLFDRQTIERWAKLFQYLLEGFVTDSQARVWSLPLLEPGERRQLLETFNDTSTDFPGDALIHELFEEQAQAHPDSVAIVHDDGCLSYDELNRRANQVAHYLLGLGVVPDDRVAICLERSADMVVAMLGVLKAGAAYVPLDPTHPPERLAQILRDSAPMAMLTQSELEQQVAGLDLPALRMDLDLRVLGRRLPTENPNPRANGLTSRHLAYVIYTSGSTGTPKGVMVEHRNVNRLVINNPFFRVDGADCLAHCANPAFDAATWEVWGALLNGARVLVVPQAVVLDSVRLCHTLLQHRATALWLTSALFSEYVATLSPALAELRYLIVGGDVLNPTSIAELLQQSRRPRHVLNGYGPTETTTFACTYEIAAVPEAGGAIPIGRPIGNTQVYILDAQQQPVPIGVAGELYIGGAGVARGYLNRPELSEERF